MEVENVTPVIELPGEANPLTEGMLVKVLLGASSYDPQQLKTSTKQLEAWETTPGYYVLLQAASGEKSIPDNARLMSLIVLKNGIDKYWRKHSANAICGDDKKRIKTRILQTCIHEQNDAISRHNAFVIAKIAKIDFPRDWSDLSSQLELAMNNFASHYLHEHPEYPIQLRNLILIALETVKELSKSAITKPPQWDIAQMFLRTMAPIFKDSMQMLDPEDPHNHTLHGRLNRARLGLLTMRTFRRTLLRMIGHLDQQNLVPDFWRGTVVHLQNIIQHVQISQSQGSFPGELPDDLTTMMRLALQMVKMFRRVAETRPADFLRLERPNFNTVRTLWAICDGFSERFLEQARLLAEGKDFHEITTSLNWVYVDFADQLCLHGLHLHRACFKMIAYGVKTFKYITAEEKQERDLDVETMAKQCFTPQQIALTVDRIVERFLLLQPKDLNDWELTPEEWEVENLDESQDISLRPCAEALLLELAIKEKDLVQPRIMNFFKLLFNTTLNSPDFGTALRKDAILNAVGATCASFRSAVNDINDSTMDLLIADALVDNSVYKIVRRRIAIFLGKLAPHIGDDFGGMAKIYEIYTFLLSSNDHMNDYVVKMTAGRYLRDVVDAWSFQPDVFAPFAERIVSSIMEHMADTEYGPGLPLLHTISVIVERMAKRANSFAGIVISPLPQIWEATENDNVTKMPIIGILKTLNNYLQADGIPYHHISLTLIRNILTEPNLTFSLSEDALKLWRSVLMETPVPSNPQESPILTMTQLICPLLTNDERNVLIATYEVAESYFLLSTDTMLNPDLLTPLFAGLTPRIGPHPALNGFLFRLSELAVQTAFLTHGVDGVHAVMTSAFDSGFLNTVLKNLKESWEAHQTTGPKAKITPIQGIVETDHLGFLSRVIYASPHLFIEALRSTSEAHTHPAKLKPKDHWHEPLDATMFWLLEEWLSHFENEPSPTRRKLMLLALTRLLDLVQSGSSGTLTGGWVLEHLQPLMALWTNVILDLTEDTGAGSRAQTVDSLVFRRNEGGNEAADVLPAFAAWDEGQDYNKEYVRREMLEWRDPVHADNLIEVVRTCLGACVQRVGGEGVFAERILANVDKEVVKGFVELGIM